MRSKNIKEKDKPQFDLLKILGLRPKKIDEKYKKYASLNRRMMAATIDTGFAVFTLEPLVNWILGDSVRSRPITSDEIAAIKMHPETEVAEMMNLLVSSGKLSEFFLSSTLQILALLIASAICWKLWSATPGKMILRMKVLDANTEQPMTNKQIILRSLSYIPACAIFFLGIFWISFNKRRQGWHDKIAGTVVIITSKKKKEAIPKELP